MLNASQDSSYNSIKEAQNIFHSKIADNDLSSVITYHGIVEGEAKSKLLSQANVFVLPSYYNIEAQPITIIEAMAYGCAIYATEYRGIPEMLEDRVNGRFIKAMDSQDLMDKLLELNEDILDKYSLKSKLKYLNRFSKENYLNNMFKIFEII